MKISARSLAVIVLIFVLAACSVAPLVTVPEIVNSASPNQEKVVALVTYLEGTATLAENGLDQVKLHQKILSGSQINLDEQSKLTLVCNNSHLVQASGPLLLPLNPATCDQGLAMPASSQEIFALKIICFKRRGSIRCRRIRDDLKVLGTTPFLVQPRSAMVWGFPQSLSWLEVENAISYQFSLEQIKDGKTTPLTSFELRSDDVNVIICQPNQATTPWQVCSLEINNTNWHPTDAVSYRIGITAYTSDGNPHTVQQSISLVSNTVRADIQSQLDQLQGLTTVDEQTRQLLLGTLFAQNQLYDEAIRHYEDLLAVTPSARIYAIIGELYQSTGQSVFASHAYAQAAQLVQQQNPDDGELQAVIWVGQGMVARDKGDLKTALTAFIEAKRLYAALNDGEAVAEIETLIQETEELR